MAKVLVNPSSYSFNAGSKKLTFNASVPPNKGAILSVVNCTTGTIMYQPQGGPEYVGTWNSPELTFACSTSGMSNADSLEVWVDDMLQVSAPRSPVTTSIPATTSSTQVLAANTNRRGVTLANLSAAYLYLSFSSPASVANCFAEIPPHAFLLFDQAMIVPNAIYGIWTAANGSAQVTEYTQ